MFLRAICTLLVSAAFTPAGAWADGPGLDARANRTGRDSYVAAAIAQTASFQASIFRWWAIRLTGAGGLTAASTPSRRWRWVRPSRSTSSDTTALLGNAVVRFHWN